MWLKKRRYKKAWIHTGWEDATQKWWYKWLEEMNKKGETEKMKEMHQHKVTQMITSGEGSVGFLHWRRGAQILANE